MRTLLLGGVAGPVLFATIVVTVAAAQTAYSHVTQFISELGASSVRGSAVMNYGGFVPAGLMLAAFGVALHRQLPRTTVATIGTSLAILFGAGIAVSGVISCDAGCPQTSGTLENRIHNVIGPLTFLFQIVATGMLSVEFRRRPRWQPLWLYSRMTSVVGLALLITLAASVESRAWTGLWQRLLVGTLFLWCGVVAIRALSEPKAQ